MHKMLDENYMDLLIQNSFAEVLKKEHPITPINSRHSILHSPVSKFNMCDIGIYPYHIFPTLYTLNSQINLESSNITTVQNNTSFSLFGQGVLIGFVDTGIDYQHKAFLNADGSTRLFSLWDQTIESETPPEDFGFGSEYNKTMINIALQDDNPLSLVPSRDEIGHGTMLAGIAAGTKSQANNFSGVASRADLVVVKLAPAKRFNKKIHNVRDSALCYLESNILLGIEYIRGVAMRINRPLVLCIGLGSSQSAHDGHSALSLYLNDLSTYPRMAVCISAGNEGNNGRHHRGEISGGQDFDNIELKVSEKDAMFPLEIWQRSLSRLAVEIISPTGERVQNIMPRLSECREHNFIFETSKLYVNNFIMEEETGDQLILIRFENAMPGIWKIRVVSIENTTSQFDSWLPSGDIISSDTFFLVPDPEVTVTSPGNAHNPLTVTAYNPLQNSILLTSSRGYSATGTITPDLAAPGYAVKGPIPNQNYGTATGTGAAAAHTTGIIALLLEWAVLKGNYTTITGRDIGRLLTRGARRDDGIVYPNPVWGYGQIDIVGLFKNFL